MNTAQARIWVGFAPGWPAFVACWLVLCANASGQEPEKAPVLPLGRWVTVTSPVDDSVFARVSSAALDLQSQATREDRAAVLILQIEPGTSPLHQVQGLARFLTSAQISRVKTVAWVPETVTGPNVVIALACREIVLHPDAELGDIARGQPLEPEDEQAVLSLGAKRHNAKVSPSLLRGMLRPEEQLWRVRIEPGNAEAETRVVTVEELETLRKTNVNITSAELLKERGVTGTFRGSTARELGILVAQVASDRSALTDLYRLEREAMRERRENIDAAHVRLIRVEGVIDPLLESFLERQLQRAVSEGAKIVILDIESPGGQLLASLNLANALASLDPNEVRTVAYVPKMALSGAAIIALGCDEIYLHPTAMFGDAGPIELREGGQFEHVPEKQLGPLRVSLRDLAERKGRAPALVEAMAIKTLKVFEVAHQETGRIWYMTEEDLHASDGSWIQGPQLRETNGDSLLTVNGERAFELKLAERPVADQEELSARLGLPPSTRLKPLERTWIDSTVFVLNTPGMQVLMLVGGVALLYLELHFLTGALGLGAVFCFVLFFWANFLGGTAGWLEVTLFVFGVICLGLEIFVLPGFGVFGVTGVLMVIASLVMAIQSFGNFESGADWRELLQGLGTVFGAFAGVIVIGVLLARLLPHTAWYDQITLGPSSMDEMALQIAHSSEGPTNQLVRTGERGIAVTMLRPAGKADINGRAVDVQSEGPFIPAGVEIEVVQVQGARVVVRNVV